MKTLIVIGLALLIMGFMGLWLASNLTYIFEEEALTYVEAKPQKWMPFQSMNQQQFNFLSGVLSVTLGIVVLASSVVLRMLEK